mmetsp:Transcript_17767/g.38759  ORF Transcript_17767/g.38759 Transcript_17767/m.38759 type:complete len:88 (-) Transcript_17767:171-434(-)
MLSNLLALKKVVEFVESVALVVEEFDDDVEFVKFVEIVMMFVEIVMFVEFIASDDAVKATRSNITAVADKENGIRPTGNLIVVTDLR